ncbi:hypothetical protein [Streptomyces sp. V4I2]|uniref:hypothetical protein n=1 Tax=Streptomyces sp. V4I2 TaxID=3042280 RepID=UPI002783BE68|nr:hypothetical protein [Streptomyces sp. V4I2]MDQ1051976.1 hypothetical protein [Streptomyces sp. V4I2]
MESTFVSTLALLVVLLLALVGLIVFAGLALLVHRHPAWAQPLVVALGGVTLMAMAVGLITTR